MLPSADLAVAHRLGDRRHAVVAPVDPVVRPADTPLDAVRDGAVDRHLERAPAAAELLHLGEPVDPVIELVVDDHVLVVVRGIGSRARSGWRRSSPAAGTRRLEVRVVADRVVRLVGARVVDRVALGGRTAHPGGPQDHELVVHLAGEPGDVGARVRIRGGVGRRAPEALRRRRARTRCRTARWPRKSQALRRPDKSRCRCDVVWIRMWHTIGTSCKHSHGQRVWIVQNRAWEFLTQLGDAGSPGRGSRATRTCSDGAIVSRREGRSAWKNPGCRPCARGVARRSRRRRPVSARRAISPARPSIEAPVL